MHLCRNLENSVHDYVIRHVETIMKELPEQIPIHLWKKFHKISIGSLHLLVHSYLLITFLFINWEQPTNIHILEFGGTSPKISVCEARPRRITRRMDGIPNLYMQSLEYIGQGPGDLKWGCTIWRIFCLLVVLQIFFIVLQRFLMIYNKFKIIGKILNDRLQNNYWKSKI